MRFAGAVGYAVSTENPAGVWKDVITEYEYYGNVIRNSRRLGAPSAVPPETSPTLTLENQISILGDANAYNNYMHIRYVRWDGNLWQVTTVEVLRPRLILTIGGLWIGNTP